MLIIYLTLDLFVEIVVVREDNYWENYLWGIFYMLSIVLVVWVTFCMSLITYTYIDRM